MLHRYDKAKGHISNGHVPPNAMLHDEVEDSKREIPGSSSFLMPGAFHSSILRPGFMQCKHRATQGHAAIQKCVAPVACSLAELKWPNHSCRTSGRRSKMFCRRLRRSLLSAVQCNANAAAAWTLASPASLPFSRQRFQKLFVCNHPKLREMRVKFSPFGSSCKVIKVIIIPTQLLVDSQCQFVAGLAVFFYRRGSRCRSFLSRGGKQSRRVLRFGRCGRDGFVGHKGHGRRRSLLDRCCEQARKCRR